MADVVDDVQSLMDRLVAARGGGPLPPGLRELVDDPVAIDGERLSLARPADWDLLCERGRLAPYWAIVWPSAEALARAVAAAPPAGRRVLEIGCGLGLPSVVAAKGGASVLATDAVPEAVVFAARNLAANGVDADTAVLDWASDPVPAEGAWDLVLGADVVFARTNVEPVLALLDRALAPGGEAWIADPDRPGGRDLLAAAERGGWRVRTALDATDRRIRVHRFARG